MTGHVTPFGRRSHRDRSPELLEALARPAAERKHAIEVLQPGKHHRAQDEHTERVMAALRATEPRLRHRRARGALVYVVAPAAWLSLLVSLFTRS